MPTREETDHLYQRLVEVLGRDAANTLMELLHVSWWALPSVLDPQRRGPAA